MKKQYTKPAIELMEVEVRDMICTSPDMYSYNGIPFETPEVEMNAGSPASES